MNHFEAKSCELFSSVSQNDCILCVFLLTFIFTLSGPCIWPSFRKPVSDAAVSVTTVYPYNNYKVTVKEVYCGKCDLFVGEFCKNGASIGCSVVVVVPIIVSPIR